MKPVLGAHFQNALSSTRGWHSRAGEKLAVQGDRALGGTRSGPWQTPGREFMATPLSKAGDQQAPGPSSPWPEGGHSHRVKQEAAQARGPH